MSLSYEIQQEIKDVQISLAQDQREQDRQARMKEDVDFEDEWEDTGEVSPIQYRRS